MSLIYKNYMMWLPNNPRLLVFVSTDYHWQVALVEGDERRGDIVWRRQAFGRVWLLSLSIWRVVFWKRKNQVLCCHTGKCSKKKISRNGIGCFVRSNEPPPWAEPDVLCQSCGEDDLAERLYLVAMIRKILRCLDSLTHFKMLSRDQSHTDLEVV